MQVLDQQVAAARPFAEQNFNVVRGRWIDLASLGRRPCPLAPLARMFERADLLHIVSH
jgi:hypothetical protein